MPENSPLVYINNTILFPQLSHSFKFNKKINKNAIFSSLETEKKEIILVALKIKYLKNLLMKIFMKQELFVP